MREAATAVVRRAHARSGGALPIIGGGECFTAEDVYEKLRAMASMVQVYTGFIDEGPGMGPSHGHTCRRAFVQLR